MAKYNGGGNREFAMRIIKIGLALVGATVVGTWATRRTAWKPLMRGIARAGGAALAAYLVRKKAPHVAIGLGTYAVATLAAGAVEEYDMTRYLAATDAQRSAQLPVTTTGGATTTGGTATGTGTTTGGALPAGSGTGLEGLAEYRRNGYAVL
jgi:hypothetical protein